MRWAKVEKRLARFPGDGQYYVVTGATKKHPHGSTIGPFGTEAEALESASRYRKSPKL